MQEAKIINMFNKMYVCLFFVTERSPSMKVYLTTLFSIVDHNLFSTTKIADHLKEVIIFDTHEDGI